MTSKFRQQLNVIQDILSIAVASCKIHEIVIIQECGKYTGLYPPISVWLYSKASSMKSTLLSDLSKVTGHTKHTKVTAASLVGSITDNGENVHPVAWNEKCSLMGIDEFNALGKGAKDTKQTILSLIEGGHIKKSISRKSVKISQKDKDDPKLYYKVEGGTIDMQTRVGICFCTMVKHTLDEFHDALISRCIPIKYLMDDPKMVFQGKAKLKLKKYKVNKKVTIKKKEWEYIYNKVIDSNMFNDSKILRVAGTLAKVYAVLGKHDDKIYNTIMALKYDNGNVSEDVGLI